MASTVFMNFASLITGINIVLISSLLYVYLKNYGEIKSTHTAGLILFASLFLVQNIFLLYFALTMSKIYAEGVGFFLFSFTILQAIAFSILNWITWK